MKSKGAAWPASASNDCNADRGTAVDFPGLLWIAVEVVTGSEGAGGKNCGCLILAGVAKSKSKVEMEETERDSEPLRGLRIGVPWRVIGVAGRTLWAARR